MVGLAQERDRHQDEHRNLRGVVVEPSRAGSDDVRRGGAAHEQQVHGSQVDVGSAGQADHRERSPRQTGERGAERSEPVVGDHLAALPPDQVAATARERREVGQADEYHEGHAAWRRHRRPEDQRQQRRGGDPEERGAAQRAVHLIGTGQPHVIAERSTGHLPLSGRRTRPLTAPPGGLCCRAGAPHVVFLGLPIDDCPSTKASLLG